MYLEILKCVFSKNKDVPLHLKPGNIDQDDYLTCNPYLNASSYPNNAVYLKLPIFLPELYSSVLCLRPSSIWSISPVSLHSDNLQF